MMGDRQPAAVDFLVDVGHDPIDFACAAVFHLGEPALGADFPGKIADDAYMSINQRHRSLRKRLVELGPVFLLRLPTNDDGGAAWTHIGHVRSLRPHLFHGRPVIDHHHCFIESLARSFHPVDISRLLGKGTVRREREQKREKWEICFEGPCPLVLPDFPGALHLVRYALVHTPLQVGDNQR